MTSPPNFLPMLLCCEALPFLRLNLGSAYAVVLLVICWLKAALLVGLFVPHAPVYGGLLLGGSLLSFAHLGFWVMGREIMLRGLVVVHPRHRGVHFPLGLFGTRRFVLLRLEPAAVAVPCLLAALLLDDLLSVPPVLLTAAGLYHHNRIEYEHTAEGIVRSAPRAEAKPDTLTLAFPAARAGGEARHHRTAPAALLMERSAKRRSS